MRYSSNLLLFNDVEYITLSFQMLIIISYVRYYECLSQPSSRAKRGNTQQI